MKQEKGHGPIKKGLFNRQEDREDNHTNSHKDNRAIQSGSDSQVRWGHEKTRKGAIRVHLVDP